MLDHASVFGGGLTAGSLPCRFISLLELEWSAGRKMKVDTDKIC